MRHEKLRPLFHAGIKSHVGRRAGGRETYAGVKTSCKHILLMSGRSGNQIVFAFLLKYLHQVKRKAHDTCGNLISDHYRLLCTKGCFVIFPRRHMSSYRLKFNVESHGKGLLISNSGFNL